MRPMILQPEEASAVYVTAVPMGRLTMPNPTGSPAFADRLIDLAANFDTPFAFDPAAGIGANQNILGFSARSSAWFSGHRSDASSNAELNEAKLARVLESLSKPNGCEH